MFKKLQLKIYRSCFPKLTFVIITFFLSFRFLIIYVIVVGIVSLNCKIGEFVCNNNYIRRQKEAKEGKKYTSERERLGTKKTKNAWTREAWESVFMVATVTKSTKQNGRRGCSVDLMLDDEPNVVGSSIMSHTKLPPLPP